MTTATIPNAKLAVLEETQGIHKDTSKDPTALLQLLCAEKQARIVLSSQGLDYTLVQVETTYSKLSYEELGPTPYPGACLHSMRWQNYFITELGKPFDLGITDGPAMETGQVCRVRWRALAIDVALFDSTLHPGSLSPRATKNMQRYVSSLQMDMQGPRPSVLVLLVVLHM